MYAQDFYEIVPALAQNIPLKSRTIDLIGSDAIVGKVTEGAGRIEALREILSKLVNDQITLHQSYSEVLRDLPQRASVHSSNKRVFSDGWPERLVRTQLSRFYNQAVLEELQQQGVTQCHVPHSSNESGDSKCTQYLAGDDHSVDHLHELLVASYRDGDFTRRQPKIPNHPHCTHVVSPKSDV